MQIFERFLGRKRRKNVSVLVVRADFSPFADDKSAKKMRAA
jgi:hypothetical protein